MKLEDVDRDLQRLRDAAERIRDDLLDVELEPNRRLLDESRLEGESAERWGATSAALLQLWEWHGLLAGLLERATKLRGAHARLRSGLVAELGEILGGASIECSSRQLSHAGGGRSGNSQSTMRLSPDELVQRMSAGCDEASALLGQIGTAWDTFTLRLRRAGERVGQSSDLCQRLGESHPRELDAARERLSQLNQALAKDPLSVTLDDIEALETSVTSVHADLEALAELPREIGDRLVGARELLEELRRAQREGEAAHADAVVKIAAPTVAPPVSLAGVEAELEQVVELSDADAWRQARDALAQWTARASSLLGEASRIAADNRAPIEARNRLRNRLEAYQAKAKQLGLIEDPDLCAIFEGAHATLYEAPTDLVDAEALLSRYQRAVAGTPARELLT